MLQIHRSDSPDSYAFDTSTARRLNLLLWTKLNIWHVQYNKQFLKYRHFKYITLWFKKKHINKQEIYFIHSPIFDQTQILILAATNPSVHGERWGPPVAMGCSWPLNHTEFDRSTSKVVGTSRAYLVGSRPLGRTSTWLVTKTRHSPARVTTGYN